jgi:2',3'-cyclic-nucleotide 2'-phosphodiesterase (5'-nucleotidase family)
MTSPLRVLLIAALASTCGCMAYNEPCKGLTENPDEVIGYLGEDVYVDKANARHANNAIGQLAADAYRTAANNLGIPSQLGVINGGGIRAEGLCVTRNIVPEGPLTNGRLHEIFLFNDLVESIDMTGAEVKRMFESAVSGLYRYDQEIASPSGSFLDVSEGTKLTVDCTRPPGDRVTALSIEGIDVLTAQDQDFRVALTDYLLHSGAGFESLRDADQDPSRRPAQANQWGGIDSNLTQHYMAENHADGKPPLVTDPDRVVWAKTTVGGSLVDSCANPGVPAPN